MADTEHPFEGPPVIACFNMPQFGIAVERLRQPILWDAPLALVDGERRVVCASEDAALMGVRPGIAEAGARTFCPRLRVLRYDGPAYREQAEDVWNVYAEESSVVEPISPELCYVLLTRSCAVERAKYLSTRLAGAVRCSFKAGLGESKFVAMQAALTAKEATTITVPIGQESALLAPISVREVPGLDKKLAERLERLGVRTLGDVLRLPQTAWPKSLSQVAQTLANFALGIDSDPVRPMWPPPSIEVSFTFEEEIGFLEPIENVLRLLSGRLGTKLLERREYCRSLALRVTLSDNSQIEDCEKLVGPTDTANDLHRASLRLLQRLRLEQQVLSLHLRACNLDNGGGLQLTLPELDNEHEIQLRLDGAISWLRKKYGPAAVFSGDKLPGRGRIGLWTYSLGRLFTEPVEVATDATGLPVRYARSNPRFAGEYEILQIQDRWKERDWDWGPQFDTVVYRVTSEHGGLQELRRIGARWMIGGAFD
jgi:DNA polymerase-4